MFTRKTLKSLTWCLFMPMVNKFSKSPNEFVGYLIVAETKRGNALAEQFVLPFQNNLTQHFLVSLF